uniref:Expansin-like CBD domain-containing protein n=1 Tax=Oryza glumipatula TaxID=40148 RepID=A0A0E0ACV7_9ORYZ
MASLSSFRLAVAVAALLVVGSCATEVTFKVGEGSSGKSLELVTNVAISEVEIKEKGGKDWVALKESSTNTWSLKIFSDSNRNGAAAAYATVVAIQLTQKAECPQIMFIPSPAPNGGKDWVALKESSTNTCTIKSEAPLKGPFSVRFLVKNGGYRVVDNVIPESFTAGSEYKSGINI